MADHPVDPRVSCLNRDLDTPTPNEGDMLKAAFMLLKDPALRNGVITIVEKLVSLEAAKN